MVKVMNDIGQNVIEFELSGVKIFAFTVPGKVKIFSNAEVEEAKQWLLKKTNCVQK